MAWVCTRPYRGITHDAVLYTVQAISRLAPNQFSDDLFFQFGSQTDFTIYPYVLATLIRISDLATANLLLAIAGQICWLSGAWLLVRSLVPNPQHRALALGALILLPSSYAGLGVFSYGEPFPSPRIFSESLSLAGIASALRQAWRPTFTLIGLAAIFHPIMALPAVVLAIFLAAANRPNVLLLPLVGGLAVLALAWADLEPFSRVSVTLSGEWWETVYRRNRFSFVSNWTTEDYALVAVQFNIAGLIYYRGNDLQRRIMRATGLTVVCGLLIGYVAGDLLRNLFFVNLQVVRATWLLNVIVNILAASLLLRTIREPDDISTPLKIGLAIYALGNFFVMMSGVALIQIACCSLAFIAARRFGALPRVARLSLLTCTSLTSLAAGAIVYVHIWISVSSWIPERLWLYGLLVVSLAAAGLYLKGQIRCATAVSISALLVFLSYNHEGRWERFARSGIRPPADLMAMIDDSKNIYWEAGTEYSWFSLGRPQYFSCRQGTGSMFYRETALEYSRRSRALAQLGTVDFARTEPSFCDPSELRGRRSEVRRDALQNVCRSLPELDLIVLLEVIPDTPHATWHLPFTLPTTDVLVLDGGPRSGHDRFYFYRCRDFRLDVPEPFSLSTATCREQISLSHFLRLDGGADGARATG